MIAAFTSATISYLPSAFTLADAFLRHNPTYRFFIFLIDPKTARLDTFKRDGIILIPIDQLKIEGLTDAINNFTISEISFSLKPALSLHLLETYPDLEHLFYFDADIAFYHEIDDAAELLKNHDLILTPHFTHPVEDDKTPTELDILRTGLYNMGFAGFRNSDNAKNILRWWKKRVLQFGYENHDLGLTADQMWMSLAPLLFDNVAIIQHPGYNFAYWNIHERELSFDKDKATINGRYPLVFVHFADFDPGKPHLFTNPKHFNRVETSANPPLQKLCRDYADDLLGNHFSTYKNIRSAYESTPGKQALKKLKSADGSREKIKQLGIVFFYLWPRGLRRLLRKFSLFILRNIK